MPSPSQDLGHSKWTMMTEKRRCSNMDECFQRELASLTQTHVPHTAVLVTFRRTIQLYRKLAASSVIANMDMEGLLSVKCLKVGLCARKVLLYDGEICKEVTWASTVRRIRKVGSMGRETLSTGESTALSHLPSSLS